MLSFILAEVDIKFRDLGHFDPTLVILKPNCKHKGKSQSLGEQLNLIQYQGTIGKPHL